MLRAACSSALQTVLASGLQASAAVEHGFAAVGAAAGSALQQTRGNKKSNKFVSMLLTQDVPNVGVASEMVKVKAGFARNYLYPQKLGRYATRQEQRDFESSQTAEDAAALEEQRAAAKAQERLTRVLRYLATKGVSIEREVRQRTTFLTQPIEMMDIVEAAAKQLRIDVKPEILAMEGPIDQIGYYQIPMKFQMEDGSVPYVYVVVDNAEKDEPLDEFPEA